MIRLSAFVLCLAAAWPASTPGAVKQIGAWTYTSGVDQRTGKPVLEIRTRSATASLALECGEPDRSQVSVGLYVSQFMGLAPREKLVVYRIDDGPPQRQEWVISKNFGRQSREPAVGQFLHAIEGANDIAFKDSKFPNSDVGIRFSLSKSTQAIDKLRQECSDQTARR